MLPAVLTTVLWSVSVVFAARSAAVIGPERANIGRLTVATLFLGCWAFIWGTGIAGPAFPWLFLSGIVGFGLGDMGLFGAIPRIGPRLTILLTQCLAAPIAALVEWIWLGTLVGWVHAGCALVLHWPQIAGCTSRERYSSPESGLG
jgi:drug/metabolite transporter (DMT)-like permease